MIGDDMLFPPGGNSGISSLGRTGGFDVVVIGLTPAFLPATPLEEQRIEVASGFLEMIFFWNNPDSRRKSTGEVCEEQLKDRSSIIYMNLISKKKKKGDTCSFCNFRLRCEVSGWVREYDV